MTTAVTVRQGEVSRLSAEFRGAKEELTASQRGEHDVAAELSVARTTAERRAQELADLKAAHRQREEEEALKFQQERDRLSEEKAALVRQVRGLEVSLQALKDAAGRGGGDTWAPDALSAQQSRGASAAAQPAGFDLANFPLSPKGATLDAFDVQGSGDDRALGPADVGWQQHEFVGLGSQAAPQQVATLHQRLTALEQERDALADELAVTVTLKDKALQDAASVPALINEIAALGKQYQLTLELLGATEEEVDDMRMTLAEVRLIYRAELERLMDAVPADHKWSVPAFPTSVHAKSRDESAL